MFEHIGGHPWRPGKKHHTRPDVPREDQIAAQTESEKKFGGRKGAVALAQIEYVHAPQLGGERVILVRVQDSLRHSGGAAGIIQRTEVVPVSERCFKLGRLAADPLGVREVIRVLRLSDDDNVLQKVLLLPDFVDNRQQRWVHNQHARTAVAQHEIVLMSLQQCVHADRNRADFGGAEE